MTPSCPSAWSARRYTDGNFVAPGKLARDWACDGRGQVKGEKRGCVRREEGAWSVNEMGDTSESSPACHRKCNGPNEVYSLTVKRFHRRFPFLDLHYIGILRLQTNCFFYKIITYNCLNPKPQNAQSALNSFQSTFRECDCKGYLNSNRYIQLIYHN
jgi:hypothetical protein